MSPQGHQGIEVKNQGPPLRGKRFLPIPEHPNPTSLNTEGCGLGEAPSRPEPVQGHQHTWAAGEGQREVMVGARDCVGSLWKLFLEAQPST